MPFPGFKPRAVLLLSACSKAEPPLGRTNTCIMQCDNLPFFRPFQAQKRTTIYLSNYKVTSVIRQILLANHFFLAGGGGTFGYRCASLQGLRSLSNRSHHLARCPMGVLHHFNVFGKAKLGLRSTMSFKATKCWWDCWQPFERDTPILAVKTLGIVGGYSSIWCLLSTMLNTFQGFLRVPVILYTAPPKWKYRSNSHYITHYCF